MFWSILLDITALLVLLICAVLYARKGFLGSLLIFLGTLGCVLLAAWVANKISPAVFASFFQESLEQQTLQALGESSAQNVSELVRGIIRFLPESMVDSLVEGLEMGLDFTVAELAAQIVQEVIAPIIIPIISVVVFFVVFGVLRVLISVLSALFSGVNKVPILGTANRALGAVVGVLIGCLYVYILMCAIWAVDASYSMGQLGQSAFSTSFVYNLLEGFNIFA